MQLYISDTNFVLVKFVRPTAQIRLTGLALDPDRDYRVRVAASDSASDFAAVPAADSMAADEPDTSTAAAGRFARRTEGVPLRVDFTVRGSPSDRERDVGEAENSGQMVQFPKRS